jgi:hypothetical protein
MYGEVREEEDEEEGEEAKLDGAIHAENVSGVLIRMFMPENNVCSFCM